MGKLCKNGNEFLAIFMALIVLMASLALVYSQEPLSLEISDITFSIEGGRGKNLVKLEPNHFQFDLVQDGGSENCAYWFMFKIMRHAQGQTVTFDIRNTSISMFSYKYVKPFYSYDGLNCIQSNIPLVTQTTASLLGKLLRKIQPTLL